MDKDKKVYVYMTPRSLILSIGLTFVFVMLKLAGYIAWSWVWVLSPLWIVQGILSLLLIIMVIVSSFLKEN